jgi:outer membrane lipoprotein-sorting protein
MGDKRVVGLFVVLLSTSLFVSTGLTDQTETGPLIRRMETAYAAVRDYQTFTVVRNFKNGKSIEVQKFSYRFKKPDHIRIDFETPHSGLVLVYPDKEGKVLLKFPGIGRLFPIHLSPHNRALMSRGQSIVQTDMGLFIDNIAHSLTDERRGKVHIIEDERFMEIDVLALDHFMKNILTLYRFRIDRALWLPVGVEQSTPEGIQQRTVALEDLKINTGVSDRFMQGE